MRYIMKRFNSPCLLMCGYDNDTCKYFISFEGGSFETPSEEVWLNQLRKMLGAPHSSDNVALLNKHVIKSHTFVNLHLTISMNYVVRPLDVLRLCQDEEYKPSYWEIEVYNYGTRVDESRIVFYTRKGAEDVYKRLFSDLLQRNFDIESQLN